MGKTKSVDVVIDPEGKWNFRRKRSSYLPHDRVTQDDDGVSNTRQEFADECDVNHLMAKYQKSGILPSPHGTPVYGDFSELPDYMEAQNTIAKANEAFALLPAAVRLRFGNDPAEFVEFAADPENIGQMRKWGLAAPAASPEAGSGTAGAAPEGQAPAAPVVSEGNPTP